MRRRLVHLLLVLLLGTVPMVLGIVVAMTATGAGRSLLTRSVVRMLDNMLLGNVEIGAISGSFLFGLNIDRMVVRDSSGELFADIPRVEVGYSIPDFLARKIVLNGVHLVAPTFQLIKHRNGRLNYEEILRLGQSKGGGPPPLVEFRDLQIDSGTVRIYLPYSFKDGVNGEADRAAELATERAKPGRIIEESPEGLRKVLKAEAVTTRMPLLRISGPDRGPIEAEVDTMALRFNDPGITLRDFVGRVRVKGDSATISIVRGAFPNSRFQGGGVLSWPKGTLFYDLAIEVPQLALRDLYWVSPKFPDMTGSASLAAISESPTRTAYVLNNLKLHQGSSAMEGAVTAVLDARRGLGVRDMEVRLKDFNLNAVRPYLDTLPLDGTLTGTLAANGFFDTMTVKIDLSFNDARIAERPASRIQANGDLHIGTPQGIMFDRFKIAVSDFDLRSVRLVSPAVRLNGHAFLAGTLNGSWKDVAFDGRVEHRDGQGAPSAMEGHVRLDTRGPVLGLESDITLDPLDFNGIRNSFPALTLKGQLVGRVKTQGDLEHLNLDMDVHGDIGAIRAIGAVTLRPPRLGADSLDVQFTGVNLAAIMDSGMTTRLNGHALISLMTDTLRAPEGTIALTLDSSAVREFSLDSLRTAFAIRDSVIQLDTLEADWGTGDAAGRVSGSGTLGWVRPKTGQMTLSLSASSLAPFDSLLSAVTGIRRDTLPTSAKLGGSATADVTLAGALDSLLARGNVTVQDFQWQRVRTPGAVATVEWTGGHRARTTISLQSDSITVGTSVYRKINVGVSGWSDSLSWAGSLQSGVLAGLSGGGRWWKRGQGWMLSLDTLTATLPEHQWQLAKPADIGIGKDVLRFTDVEVRTADGSGTLKVSGELPRTSPGHLTIEGQGLALRDIYSLLQKDTTGVAGSLALNVELGGTAAEPTMSGTGTLGDIVLGDFRAPFVQGVFNYEKHQLDANLLLWRTGVQVLRIEAKLPLDLALQGAKQRQLPGALFIRAQADSVNLALLEAFTPSIQKVSGLLKSDVEINGTWEDPELTGFIEVINGAVTLPSLGVRYGYMNGRLNFTGDSIVVDHFRTTSGPGSLEVTGAIELERLTKPVLGLGLTADNFLAINNPTFLTLQASGTGTLTGPVYGATLRGDIVANSGALHFADLLTKRVVNLSDPTIQDLVDTTLIRTQKLGAAFQNVFLDSLNIRDMRLTVQDQFWLRSSDANVQLEGSVLVNKTGKNYRFDGTFTALRGNYSLHIGFVTRDFQVDRGTVRYFGTPDLNADLDIQATHIVETSTEEIPVIAKITGTLLLPKLSLESTIRPAPTESELVSYLMFGRPSPDLPGIGAANTGQQQAALETGLAYLGSALSSEIQRTLISDIGIPIDFFEIRAGGGNLFSGQGTSQVTAGWQLGTKTFFTLNAGFCQDFSNLGAKSFGSGIEYRLSRVWRLQASYEPVINCLRSGSSTNTLQGIRKQFGFDVLWEKEY